MSEGRARQVAAGDRKTAAAWSPVWHCLAPLEWIAVFSVAAALVLKTGFSLRFYFPDGHSTVFALGHYIAGLLAASILALIFSSNVLKRDNLTIVLRKILAFALIVYLHFNFKLWAQLINPHLFDSWYQHSDELIAPVIKALDFLSYGFSPLKKLLPNAYHDIFVFMFFGAFLLHAFIRRARPHLRELTSAIALVLSIGGLAYMIAPAWGPFLYAPALDGAARTAQQAMIEFQKSFVASSGAQYGGANFIMPLAAMRSLHIAHVLILWFYVRRSVRWAGYVYLPLLVFILIEAVAARWHYVIDLLFGLFLAAACLWIVKRIYRSEKAATDFAALTD